MLVIRSVFVDKSIMCIAQRSPACCVITAVTRLLCTAVTRLLCDHKHLMCTAAIRSLFDHSGYPLGVCSLYACGFSTEVCAASATVKQEQVFDGNVLCDVCGRFSQWDRCRVTSKKEGLWKCGNCHSKENTLRRCFGQWPLETFQGLDVDKKRAFMAKISEMSSVGVAKEAEDFINHESHSEFYVDSGEFLPLTVWQARGFDIVAIVEKSRPSDMKDHDVLGKTYRVSLLTTGNKGEKGIKRRSALQISSAVQKKQIALASPAEAADTSLVAAASASTDNDNGEDIDGSSSSDTTSSTSSSLASDRKKKHKKHKKSKKNKKQEKKRNHVKNGKKDKKNRDRKADKKPETPAEIRANLKQAKACEKEEIKRKNDKKKIAGLILGKLNAAVVSMEVVAQNNAIELVPVLIANPFLEKMQAFKGYVRLATEVIQADGEGDLPVVDMQALSA